jgi:hypothetical protein
MSHAVRCNSLVNVQIFDTCHLFGHKKQIQDIKVTFKQGEIN